MSKTSVTYIHHCGSDLSIANAARVSFNKESKSFSDKDHSLIKYLVREGHHSPLNHSFLTLRVKAPIFVARQLVKHKFMPWNEVSRRYVDEEREFHVPEEFRKRAGDKKQGSSDEVFDPKFVGGLGSEYLDRLCKESLALYLDFLDIGVALNKPVWCFPLTRTLSGTGVVP